MCIHIPQEPPKTSFTQSMEEDPQKSGQSAMKRLHGEIGKRKKSDCVSLDKKTTTTVGIRAVVIARKAWHLPTAFTVLPDTCCFLFFCRVAPEIS